MAGLCLVTGGAGFIGSHLVESLAQTGRSVRVLDDLSTGLRENLAHLGERVELQVGDVGDPAAVETAMRDVEVVFHLAAVASVQRSVEAPADSHRICATGTLHVLDAARRAGVRRVVYAGSASAYGVPDGPVQSEQTPLRPLSPYAAAKLSGEFYCQAFASSYGLETVRLRFFNIFGPRQRADSPYSGVIAIFVGLLTQGKTPTIFGDGEQTRDFTYVGDVVQALRLAADQPGISGEVYNVGTGRATSLLQLFGELNRQLGTHLTANHAEARAGDIRHSRADISKIQRELGYQPSVSLEQGLADTLAWYRTQSAR
jgi:UDP-glucose 4-epimerase